MKILRDADEAETILAFLSAEIDSERFRADILDALEAIHADERLIREASLTNAEENDARKHVLAAFRGYGRNEKLFERFPAEIQWYWAECEATDLDNIHYINYSYWNELSQHTRSPLVAAETIRKNITIYHVPNDNFLSGKEYLLQGNQFKPVILLTSDQRAYTVIEGHSRMTVYGLIPEKFAGTNCYVGICNENALKRWQGV